MELYLIRHPRVAVAPGVCYGMSNVALAEDAAAVAARLAPLLPADCRLVSSPLSRCRALAEALSDQVAFEPRLAEMDFGDWEMKPFDDIDPAVIEIWAADPFGFCPPGGESARDMAARVREAFREIREALGEGPLAIVSHGGPLRAMAAELLCLPEERWLSLDFACGQMSLLELADERVTLKWFNRG